MEIGKSCFTNHIDIVWPLSQDGKLVVEDIPLVVWGLCFGKVGGVISFLFGPVRGCPRMGPQCLLTPPVSASSIYAAVVYVSGG